MSLIIPRLSYVFIVPTSYISEYYYFSVIFLISVNKFKRYITTRKLVCEIAVIVAVFNYNTF